MKVEAVLFDLDGTLIDSVPAYTKMLEIIVSRLNLNPATKEVVAELMKGGLAAWEVLIPEEMKDRKEALREQIMEVGMEAGRDIFLNEVRLIPGSTEIFSQLSANKIKIGVVTSTHAKFIDGKLLPLKEKGIDQLIDTVITIEDAPNVKPAPDPLIECARRLGVAEEQSVYVGDSHIDIRAGKAAGMKTVAVLTGIDDYEILEKEDPDMIVDSVIELRDVFT
jgi:HAD superfamily hydrolase (TIGR01509 family)